MSNFLDAYTALNAASPRSEVAAVLQSISNAATQPFAIDDAKRRELIQTIIDDLTKVNAKDGKKGRLIVKDAAPALETVKSLGKKPAGSEVIASTTNMSLILSFSRAFKDDLEASNEALRCVANAMLLVDQARATFIRKEVGGGDLAIELLERSTSPDRIFLACRLLFLSTVSLSIASGFIRTLVESKSPSHPSNTIEIIGTKLDLLTRAILSGTKMAREAMTDLLKFTFNLLLHYPKIVDESPNDSKVMGDCWSDKLDGILLPLLRTFHTLPPSFPAPLIAPMTHVIHALITIPVSGSLHSVWFPPTKRSSPTPSTKSARRARDSASPPLPASDSRKSSFSLSSGSPSSSPSKDVRGAFDRAISAARRSLSRSTSPQPAAPPIDVLQRAFDLLEVSLGHYFPGALDADALSAREKVRAETDGTVDDVLVPLLVLLTKACTADETARARMRQWLVPDDLDRTSPLEEREDTLGRLLRLLASVHHAKTKTAVGEMLYAACDSDASTLSSYVGYGNVAGFLFNKGIMSAPPPPRTATAPSATASGVPIDPITGIAEKPKEPLDMTDEEKEREAEKLFVLFDRLEKSGAIPADQNPVRKAIQKANS